LYASLLTKVQEDADGMARGLIESLGRGHRVKHAPNLFEELLALKVRVWSEWRANLAEPPSESDFTRTCNQDAGSCDVTRAKPES